MYRDVPIVSLSGYAALQALACANSATSREANAIHKAATDVALAAEQSFTLFGEKAPLLFLVGGARFGLCASCSWDGGDAAAIDQTAILSAERFVRSMPEEIPLPEFTPEPDGSISLDWIHSSNRQFSVSVGRGNRLAYAWLDGTGRGYGVVGFDGRNVPARDRREHNWDRGSAGMLASGLRKLLRTRRILRGSLTSSSQFNTRVVKHAAFLPSQNDRETSVFRHGSEPRDALCKIGVAHVAGSRTLHGAAIVKARDVRAVPLEVGANEPPPRHAAIGGWVVDNNDPELQKAQRKQQAMEIASKAILLRR